MAKKEKYITKSEKDYKKDIHIAFLQGSEKTMVIMLNAVVDELWRMKIALDENDIRRIADTFNRYCNYFEHDALKTNDFLENFEKWTGMSFNWAGTSEGRMKAVREAIKTGYFDGMERNYREQQKNEKV